MAKLEALVQVLVKPRFFKDHGAIGAPQRVDDAHDPWRKRILQGMALRDLHLDIQQQNLLHGLAFLHDLYGLYVRWYRMIKYNCIQLLHGLQ